MKPKKRPYRGLQVVPIHIIGEFIDDANEQTPHGEASRLKSKKAPTRKPKKGRNRNN